MIQLVELLILANFDYFSAFISFDMSLKIPNRSSRIVCNSPRWNKIGQVGGVSLVLARHSNMNQVIGLTSKAKDIRSSVLSNGIVL